MIITLNADFSANNIGHIDLPVEPTERQKAILAKYNREFSQAQISAFVRFMNTLENNGILSKMNRFYLPILADSTSVAFMNLVSDALDINYTPNDSWHIDEDGGIYWDSTGTWQALWAGSTSALNDLTIGDIHFLWSTNLRNKNIISTNNNYPYAYFPTIATNYPNDTWYETGVGNTNGSWCAISQRFKIGGTRKNLTDLYDFDSPYNTLIAINQNIDDLIGFNCYNDKYYILSQGQKKSYNKKSGADLTGGFESFCISGNTDYRKGFQAPCKVLSIGHGLTVEEYTIYVNAMQLFLDEF